MTTTKVRTELDCIGAVDCPGPHVEGCWGESDETKRAWYLADECDECETNGRNCSLHDGR